MRRLLGRVGVVLLVASAPVGVYFFAPRERPAYPQQWDARVVSVVRFVEQERGLRFGHPVDVQFLDDAAFRREVTQPEGDAEDTAQEQAMAAQMRALGLLSGAVDLHQAADDFLASSVVGLYVPEGKKLLVRGTELTPYVRATLAHELTHALQDQHFDLAALQARQDVDPNAVQALIEGDAMRVQDAYRRQLSSADQHAYDQADDELGGGSQPDEPDVPAVLQNLFSLPYAFGPAYLDYLVARGGNASVDHAFRHPPRVDAQVVDPWDYPNDWRPTQLPELRVPDGATGQENPEPFGQVALLMVAGSASSWADAWADVQGWQGDTWQPYELDGRDCVAVDVAMSDASHARRLAAGLGRWAGRLPQASATAAGSRVSLRSCDPGPDSTLPTRSPDPFAVLAGRADLIHLLMDEDGWGFHGAQCVTDRLLTELGPTLFLADPDEQPPQMLEKVQDAYDAASDAC